MTHLQSAKKAYEEFIKDSPMGLGKKEAREYFNKEDFTFGYVLGASAEERKHFYQTQ